MHFQSNYDELQANTGRRSGIQLHLQAFRDSTCCNDSRSGEDELPPIQAAAVGYSFIYRHVQTVRVAIILVLGMLNSRCQIRLSSPSLLRVISLHHHRPHLISFHHFVWITSSKILPYLCLVFKESCHYMILFQGRVAT